MRINRTLCIATSIILLVFCLPVQAEALNNVPAHIAQPAANPPGQIYGKITEVINASGYTYIHIDDGKNQIWAAGPTTALNKGDMIAFDTGMAMKNFHSKSMNRDFNIIYFVDRFMTDKIATDSGDPVTQEPHGKIVQQGSATPITGIEKIKNGNSIAEIITHKKSLQDKMVRVRGKVSKFTAEVMGKNWLHIRDSSTLDDLTITTKNTVKSGDIVIVEGTLKLDMDYSYGYVYPVIVEDATVTKE